MNRIAPNILPRCGLSRGLDVGSTATKLECVKALGWLTGATVQADGEPIIRDGRLLVG